MIAIKGSRDYLVALESVAMTDIVLNMFIFFFISFSLLYTFSQEKTKKVEVTLPSSKSRVSLEGAQTMVLTVARDGALFLDGEPVKPKGLREALGSLSSGGRSLVLKVDRAARFESVVKVLDVVDELGIRRLSVAAMGK